MQKYNKKLKCLSSQLRTNMTDAEQVIWYHVRRKQIHGVQFNRQKPILTYIVDFYCARAKLVVELDGGQHFDEEYRLKDKLRDKDLTDIGLLVLRFDNNQVLTETDNVISQIYNIVEERLNLP